MLLTGGGVVVHGQETPAETTLHSQPVWKLVVALDGDLVLGQPGSPGTRSSAVLVPPDVQHTLTASGAFRCLLAEPWVAGVPSPSSEIRHLDGKTAQRLAEEATSAGTSSSGSELRGLAAAFLGTARLYRDDWQPARVGARVREAAVRSLEVETLRELASHLGLSPVRLREVVRAELGVPLVRLRLWQRLVRTAGAEGTGLAERAAAAGFSDQAHLSRTSRRMVGRSPADLLAHRAAPQA
ncbi:AraC family transcriptional regulator [Goekera deserti]|uniref:AraC family transcriptional regulator n=1 Tax=Goekera deserti TaxID=2497753 RepID=A0A7K3WHH2_9ACTN|nr:helix-turn-helix domain-containing protein [Goekera deserti]NDI47374.1 helix-turn-helix domain-containing protein [Goekera deserti]NEL55904.1 AraC family transcriptional regulator [Goekera deserti]